ncbi:MAG: sulfur carrier protein ThiS [Pseudomonadota bacterium]
MRIELNGAAAEVTETRLDLALSELGYGGALVATALNGEFVAAGARAETSLTAGDRLEVVAPLRGG